MALQADAKRQAVASIRGYAYQVALTALAWLELDVAELIIVEGAEDFDRLGHEDELNQAKAVASNLTLRSAEILDGIQNFWNAIDGNPGRKLRYRFLSTAAAGTEQGRPFPMPGLSFWQSIKNSDANADRALDCRSIADFLIANKAFSTDLDGFLRNADGEEIYRRLMSPMEFVMDGPGLPAIEQTIKDRLVILGEKFRISAPNAEKAFDTILGTVWRAASSKNVEDRRLDRAALLRTFSTFTERSVPGNFVENFQQFAGLLGKFQSTLLNNVAGLATTVAVTVFPPPPLPLHYFRRPAVLSGIAEITVADGVSLIVGPRKIGKTLMAAAVAEYMGGEWLWIDLSRAEAAPEILRAAAIEISGHSGYTGVVVDAMPTLELHGNVGLGLAMLRATITAANGKLLITTDREPTASIMTAAGIDPGCTVTLEPISETEISLYLQQLGCPLAVAEAWDSILLARTLGEPLLLSIRVASLQRDGFPMPDYSDLIEPHHGVALAQRDVRLLAKQTLDERAYELLTRLSLAHNSFTREMIVEIASAEPSVASAGSTLDSLIGAWVHQLAPDRYQVSSIASTFATDEHPKPWVRDMHANIARAILFPETITTDDAANALLQAIYGEEADVIRSVLGQFFSSNDDDLWSAFARSSSLLSSLWLHELSLPKYFDDSLATLFRLTQLRISATNDALIDEGLFGKFDSEYPIHGDEKQRIIRFLGLTMILTKARGSFQGEQGVQYVQEWAQLFEIALPADMLAEAKQSLQTSHGVSEPLAPMAFLAIGNGQTARDFESIVLAAFSRGPAFVRSFFEIVENDLHLAIGLASSLWAPEVRKGDGSLQEVALSLKRSCGVLLDCGLLVLPDALGNASVKVACDFGDGPEAAMMIYDELRERAPRA